MACYIIRARYGYFFGFSDSGEPLFCAERPSARRMAQGRAAHLARTLADEGCGELCVEPN